MNRRERRLAASQPQATSNGAGAGTAAALHQAARGHLRAGEHLNAQLCAQQALAIDANHAGSLHLMGLLSLHARQYDHAVEWLSRAIRQDARPEYLLSLGTALQQQGRLEDALQVFDKAVQLKPDAAELWKHLGNVLLALNRPADALLSFQHVLKLDPRHFDAALRSGVLLNDLMRFEEALLHFNLCHELQPDNALALRARAVALSGLKRFEQSLADNRRAQALDPDNADIANNIGATLHRLGRYEESLDCFERALQRSPGDVQILKHKASSLAKIRRFDDMMATLQRIKALDPGNAEADQALGHFNLLTGNFEAGWPGYEARRNVPSRAAAYPTFTQPLWLGDGAIEGKTILIYADEGLGDAIQFARYLPMLAARGARIILVVDAPAYPLLSDLPGVSQCFAKPAGTLPAFDLHCPMCSLPLAFGTRLDTIPPGISYLPPSAAARVRAWENRLGPHDRLRVGLVWSGNPKHTNDHNRSIPLQMFSRILGADATFVSLQKDPRPDDRAVLLQQSAIVDPTADLTDLAETAALINCLDLVIAVDTSVAHLAGAQGCPTWILLPSVPDWRWLLDRDDSPWYPTVRLFRQDETRDYAPVLDRVQNELLKVIAAR
jgi:tetratricopeptide (TPR) repeat protein